MLKIKELMKKSKCTTGLLMFIYIFPALTASQVLPYLISDNKKADLHYPLSRFTTTFVPNKQARNYYEHCNIHGTFYVVISKA